ncbi:MAG TPA: hypothetical protein VK665_15970 [Candidatus Elarobacter sp.]|nr:hypothetical protein [Candidatus Elarobacter sp.]
MPRSVSPAGFTLLILIAGIALGSALTGEPQRADGQIGQNPCSQVRIAPTMPPTFNLAGSLDFQISADCWAWQAFIYENWRAKGRGVPNGGIGPNVFGLPVPKAGAYTTVWESYANPDDVFGTSLARRNRLLSASRGNGLRTLSAISKADGDDVHLSSFQQAFTLGWLTSRRGDVTFYEERINNDELSYITSPVNDLTSIGAQARCVRTGGLSLPAGTNDKDCRGNPATYGNQGAMEIKAAWIELHDPALYSRYLISRANLQYPDGRVVNDAVIGLVGLHIIRKVPSAAQFAWATWEQVDNDPDQTPYVPPPNTAPPVANPTATPAWTYFNPNCTGASCAVNTQATPCANGRTPPPSGCQPYRVPTQTKRVVPVSNFAEQSTGTFRAALARAHANASVFRYYRMIDVQWPRTPTPTQQRPNATIPLSQGSPAPVWKVANSTLETYVQGRAACMDCHQQAAIAGSSTTAGGRAHIRLLSPALVRRGALRAGNPRYASDWSFVFGKAQRP